jgi:replicative DNA helicase
MRRTMLTLIAFAALSTWVGAQGPSALTAEIQVKQFKSNRILIENLVDRGVELAGADSPLRRAEACQRTAGTLAHYLARAAGNEDADRVAEFANLYSEVVRDGLLPNLAEAKKRIKDPESPEAAPVKEVSDLARLDLDGVRKSIPSEGKVAESDKVQSALQKINELASKLGK